MLTVAKDGSGDFKRVSDALTWLEQHEDEPRIIFIRKGLYEESVEVHLPHVTLLGEETEHTVISYFLYAMMPREDIGKLGTFRSYTMFIDASDFTAANMTIANTAGTGPDVGQGVAVYADGDRIHFENCRLLGHTDTLFTGPLPPFELKKYGFTGPKQFAPRINGRHLYRNCYIEGDVDFIFGSATAYFERCEIHSMNRGMPVNSFATAASTAEGQQYGYVFEGCQFTGSCPPKTAYLGRPWRNFARTVILRSYLGPHIRPEGWHNWDKPEAEGTILYAEYENFGEGWVPDMRPSWAHILTKEEAEAYTKEKVLGGADGWAG